MGEDAVISIEGLHVSYGDVHAVRGVSLEVGRGEIFGMLGPNGAGKTTTLSVIEGLVKPREGRVRVLGDDVTERPNAVKRALGVSLQSTAFFDNLALWELIVLYASFYEVYLSKKAVTDLLARFELADKADKSARELSGGQAQRVALALAIANDPKIVILDEPTTGLDPQARRHVWDIVREIRAEGRTVLLTTHYMEEAEELCHRLAIIDKGQVVAEGTPGGLVNALEATSTITVTLKVEEADVRGLPAVTEVRIEGARLVLRSRNTHATIVALQRVASDKDQILADLSIKAPSLEDVFLAKTGRKIRS
jgi:ABC-2 type transport system ATP-binding protein